MSQDTFIKKKLFFLREKCFYSYINISTMIFNYTQMKMAQTSPNMSSIGELCDRLGETSLTSLVVNHWATGVLRVNSYSGRLIIFPLFLLGGIAILPMTPKADCAHQTFSKMAFSPKMLLKTFINDK